MSYVQAGDEQLAGIFSAIGGAFKKAGGFVAKKVAPIALRAVPVVGGIAADAYSTIPGVQSRAPVLRTTMSTPGIVAPRESLFQRMKRLAQERLRQDPELRERTVDYLSRSDTIPPDVLREAAARRAARAAAAAPAVAKAGAALLPLAVVAAVALARRRS